MITPADIQDAKRPHGYAHVTRSVAGPNGGGKAPRYRAILDPTTGAVKRGPSRLTAASAAQDYCDYANGAGIQPRPAALPSVGHKRPKRRKRPVAPEPVQEARQTIRSWQEQVAVLYAPQNHIYLIGVVGDRYAVKVGEARDPQARLIELQTANPRPLVLLGYVKTDVAKDADKIEAHPKMVRFHVNGEWFRPAAEVLSYFDVSPTTYLRKTAEPRQTRRAA